MNVIGYNSPLAKFDGERASLLSCSVRLKSPKSVSRRRSTTTTRDRLHGKKTELLDKICSSNFQDRNESIYKVSSTVDHFWMIYGRKTAIFGHFPKWPDMRIMLCHEVDRNIVQSSPTNVKLDWTRLLSTLYTFIYISFEYVQNL